MKTRYAIMIAAALLTIQPFAIARSADNTLTPPRPNVLFIILDDLNTRLGCMGDKDARTPNIDRLATHGVVFERAYCQSPSCHPSRSSFLSGMRPERTMIFSFDKRVRDVVPDVVFMPAHFTNNGYFTGRIDKVFHNGLDYPDCWTVSEEPYGKVVQLVQDHKELGLEGKVTPLPRMRGMTGENGQLWIVKDTDVKEEKFPDVIDAAKGISYMERALSEKKPFFVAVGLRRQHLTWVVPERFAKRIDPAKLEIGDRSPGENGELMPEEDLRNGRWGYLAAETYSDDQVGKLLDFLERQKLWDNTVVVLIGDNGYCLGEQANHFGKGNFFERSVHVPLIIATPNSSQAGKKTRHIVELLDLYPTLVDLAGLPKPSSLLQGRSLVPLLKNTAGQWEDRAVSIRPLNWKPDETKFLRTVRTDRYRLNVDPQGKPAELFDAEADPLQQKNLVNDPSQKKTIMQLIELLNQHGAKDSGS